MQTELENLREENKVLKHNYAWLQKMLKQKTTDHETAIDEQEEFLYGKLETTREDLSEAKKSLALANADAQALQARLDESEARRAKTEQQARNYVAKLMNRHNEEKEKLLRELDESKELLRRAKEDVQQEENKVLKQKTIEHETAIDEQEEFLYGKLETTREDLKKATKDLSEAKKGLALVNSEARYTGIDLAKSKTALAKSEKARAAIKQEPQTYKQSYGPDEVNMRNAYMISF